MQQGHPECNLRMTGAMRWPLLQHRRSESVERNVFVYDGGSENALGGKLQKQSVAVTDKNLGKAALYCSHPEFCPTDLQSFIPG